MESEVFWWIGAVVSAVAVFVMLAAVLLLIWGRLIHDRFHAILFRKTERRMSVASWQGSRVVSRHGPDDGMSGFDDWPVNERPLYLSYRFSKKRRLFFLAGIMTGPRSSVGKGKHPAADALIAALEPKT